MREETVALVLTILVEVCVSGACMIKSICPIVVEEKYINYTISTIIVLKNSNGLSTHQFKAISYNTLSVQCRVY